MTVAQERVAAEHTAGTDRLNRDMAQEARTDQEMESIVPPVSKSGTGWRIAAAVAVLAALIAGLVLMS